MSLMIKQYARYTDHLLNRTCLITLQIREPYKTIYVTVQNLCELSTNHGHISVFFHFSQILKLHCVEGCVQAFLQPIAATHKHDTM